MSFVMTTLKVKSPQSVMIMKERQLLRFRQTSKANSSCEANLFWSDLF